jgi:hypothetical protein
VAFDKALHLLANFVILPLFQRAGDIIMTDPDKLDARLSRVYDNPGDKQSLFDDWAPTYDHDLVNELGYVADAEACGRCRGLSPT